ncbi:DUF3630 family protein [Shewanella corallii]|uniref:DUF3630 family protein n=1 Tax=Shewanella corallii TaxID=560080 RepID=A0ABT0NCP6_9GAMM|nr:DUF3630 family protein [Shewanella corallii]MCL2916241.1 DUF3630 family protein [Shewanella corallii]
MEQIKVAGFQLDPTNLSLQIHAQVDFEQFDDFALPLTTALDCRILEKQWGADRHQWLLDFEGTRLWLHYEFYGDICWLSVERQDELEVLDYLSRLLPVAAIERH